MAFPQAGASGSIPFANRNGHHPCVDFHATLMALVDGKLEGVVTRRDTRFSAEAGIPWFKLGWIDGRCANARLQKYGIDAALLESVEDVDEFLLLSLYGLGRVGEGVGPVDTSDGGEPDGPHLVFR